MAVVARFGTHDGVKGGNGAQNPAVTVNPAEYPLTDPVFQNFTAQQNLTLGTAGAASTYSEVAPVEPSEEVTEPRPDAGAQGPAAPRAGRAQGQERGRADRGREGAHARGRGRAQEREDEVAIDWLCRAKPQDWTVAGRPSSASSPQGTTPTGLCPG